MKPVVDTLLVGARVAAPNEAGRIEVADDLVVGISGEMIDYVGPMPDDVAAAETVDCAGRLLTPALIDCHTHLVFAGDRIGDYERRLQGATYAEIARSGGGITRTVEATRAASEGELYETAAERVHWLMSSGVATVEIKSGYGLDLDTELRMLRVARRLGAAMPVTVATSLLAAHAIPVEFASDSDAYVDLVCDEIIPAAAEAGLADAVDAFCESIAFNPDQVRRVFAAATAAGLPVRLHADQLSDLGGGALAAEYNALSADHLEHTTGPGLGALAAAGTIAVVIPGAATFLDETYRPPIAEMRRAGVRIAVATDLNPGSAPLGSMQLAMALAATRFGLTPDEALLGATVNAAAALALEDRGRVAVGMRADLALWNAESPAALVYWFGVPLLTQLWVGGSRVPEVGC